ncbi:antibiotic biosynthesis monooxygenase [Leucobacter allii]|uniref:putative quinol monooxygenase n=1 Tax=Leucobacter allii TaxID=2932247 RepID=UPI001FD59200|nr:antibiotic biosynthesis monooxygenase family protein [Leucobacter allii]UOR02504.1 antibiotic biosynthesis monooxygenase [Leucobacter allii]
MPTPLIVIVRLRPRAGAEDELLDVFRRFSPGVFLERGCEKFALHRDDDVFMVVERWESREIWEEHLAQPENARLNAALAPLLAHPADVWDLLPLEIGDPEKSLI